jgi:hypothetical protein
MSDRMALKIAVDLVHVPSQVRFLRSEPLPDGVLMVLRIAAGEEESEQAAVALTGRSLDLIRKAAMFYIEQILFAPDADSYRVLGATPQANSGELRRNVALLLRWLHPDLDPGGERSVFISRVTVAWNNVKTPERRQAYDQQQRRSQSGSKSRSKTGKFRTGRHAAYKQFANGGFSRTQFSGARLRIRGAERIGILRRALAMLFPWRLQ